MTRILAIVPVWKRPEVTRACFDALASVRGTWVSCLFAEGGSQLTGLEVAYCLSLDDPNPITYPAWVGSRPFHRTYSTNLPLGRKWNNLTRYALNHLPGWDYLWVLGSDTIVTPGILDMYRPHIEEGCERIGLRDCYFWERGELLYFSGYREHRSDSIGCGRMVRRDLVDEAMRQGGLWDDGLSRRLDGIMTMRLDAIGSRERLLYQRHHEQREFMLEVRTEEQVTNLDDFAPGELERVVTPPEVYALLERVGMTPVS